MRILLRTLTALRPYGWQVAAMLACLVIVTVTSLVTPGIIQYVIDYGLQRRQASAMAQAGLVIIGVGLVRSLFNLAKRYLSEWLMNRTGYDYRNLLYDKIQRLPFGFHDHTQTGQLMSRCTEDLSALSRFVGQGAVELLSVLLLLIGIVVLLIRQSLTLTLIGFGPLLVLGGMTWYLGTIIGPIFLKVDQALGDVSAAVQENLAGVQVVRAFAREPHERGKFDVANRKLYHARIRIVSTWAFFMPTMTILVMASTALVLWFGGQMVMSGALTLGEVVAFNAYLLLLAAPVQQLAFVVNSAGEAQAGGQRLFEILDLPDEIASPPNAAPLPAPTRRGAFEEGYFSSRGARR